MLLRVDRIESDEESSLGKLFIDGQFECWTLEDRYRQGEKVHGKTRIPSGRYRVQLRREGGFHTNYLARYNEPWHQGMLHVRDVPGFEYILIHVGNSHDDTEGCLLVGKGKTLVEGHHYITESRGAYSAMYPKVRDALLAGEQVEIEYRDLDPASQPAAPESMIVSPGGAAAANDRNDHSGVVAGAIAAAGAGVAAGAGGLLLEDDGAQGAPADAPPAPATPEGAPEGGGAESEFFDDVVARVSDPSNLIEVVLIALGVLIVIFAIYFLVRRFRRG